MCPGGPKLSIQFSSLEIRVTGRTSDHRPRSFYSKCHTDSEQKGFMTYIMGQHGKHLLSGILAFLQCPSKHQQKLSDEPARKVTQKLNAIRLKAVCLINVNRLKSFWEKSFLPLPLSPLHLPLVMDASMNFLSIFLWMEWGQYVCIISEALSNSKNIPPENFGLFDHLKTLQQFLEFIKLEVSKCWGRKKRYLMPVNPLPQPQHPP